MKAPSVSPPRQRWMRIAEDLRREHGFEPQHVEGRIPPDLRGTLYRNGPALSRALGMEYETHFDGDGAVSAVWFGPSGAQGAVRLVETPGLRAERRAGRRLYSSFSTVGPSWWRRVGARIKNVANTNVLCWQDRLFALYEGGKPTELRSDDLSTLSETDFEGAVPVTFSAHYHEVSERQAIYNFGVRYGAVGKLDLFELPFAGPARRMATLPLPRSPMIHDFVATNRHLVFFVPPVRLRAWPLLFGIGSPLQHLRWEPEAGTEVIVVPIDRPSEPVRFFVDAFYQWHFVNGFEEGEDIVVDLVRYPDFGSVEPLRTRGEMKTDIAPGTLFRHRVNPRSRTVRCEERYLRSCEFPQMRSDLRGRRHRFAYVTAHSKGRLGQTGPMDLLSKVEPETGKAVEISLGEDQYPSEPIFAPRSESEDDGYLLALVYDARAHLSYVAVLDARDLEGGPLAKAWFDQHIPFSFHGVWVPG